MYQYYQRIVYFLKQFYERKKIKFYYVIITYLNHCDSSRGTYMINMRFDITLKHIIHTI
jgi:hypothetical protein